MTMKVKLEKKIKSYKHDTNRPRPTRHGQEYTKM